MADDTRRAAPAGPATSSSPAVPAGLAGLAELAVEPAALAVRFADMLHRAGVPVTPERAGRFAQALRLLPPDTRDRLYWAAKITLVSGRAQLATFDRVFAAVFDGMLDPADSRGDSSGPPSVRAQSQQRPAPAGSRAIDGGPPQPADVTAPGPGRADDSGEDGLAEREAVLAAASPHERLRQTSFAELAPEEIAALRQLVRRIALATPTRRSRRSRPTYRARERVDLRRTLRRAQRSGGDPARLVHRQRQLRPRRLVLLCDVSGSMDPYTQVFLSLLQGAVADVRAEAFVFATRLTRLTRSLAGHDLDAALARAAATAPDWAGGTRLGGNLRRFIDEFGRRGMARGAVVVVLSDGWDVDDPRLVAEQMARLRRLAFRIVWVNPRKAARGYAPLVGGMAAALPYCDAFVSGHTVAALAEVAAAVRASDGEARSTTKRRNR